MNKNLTVTYLIAGALLTGGGTALAQHPEPRPATAQISDRAAIDDDLQLFRKDVRSLKKQIIAANLDLTDTEAQQFWPIYDRYAAELAAISDKKYALLTDYTRDYFDMSGEQAEGYVKGRAEVEQSVMELRLKYFPIFRKAVSAKTTALFFQIDWRLGLIVDLQLASQTPIIEP
jgi:Spy/CpxP family protein refolding chaperone